MRRQHDHSLQVAIQLRRVICRQHQCLRKNRNIVFRLACGARLFERGARPVVHMHRRDGEARGQLHTVDLRGSRDPLQDEQPIQANGGCFADLDVRQLDVTSLLVSPKGRRLVQGIEKLRGDLPRLGIDFPDSYVSAVFERRHTGVGERALK